MIFRRFPDFGKDLMRPFPVHENCHDCAEFYDGCKAWPESKTFRCADYLKLPDVMPGTHGQVFPPSRMGDRKEPRVLPAKRPRPQEQTDQDDQVASEPEQTARQCPCGAPLPRHRQYCDECRRQNRRESKRQYMRDYMQGRRAG